MEVRHGAVLAHFGWAGGIGYRGEVGDSIEADTSLATGLKLHLKILRSHFHCRAHSPCIPSAFCRDQNIG